MKILKIGSSPSCDIVLDSDFVSAHHADLTILDNGEIIIEDKNSKNGTFVKSKKIQPNQEVSVKRGDLIRIADTDLPWARVPSPANNKKYKAIINIGSNFRNDVVVNSGTVSRFHAVLKVEKNGKAFIFDNDSKNGLQVNGVRINGSARVKRGDNIICGGEDITEQIRPFIPPTVPVWAWSVGGITAAAAIVVAIFFGLKWWGNTERAVTPDQVRPGVVYVRAAYHYEVTVEDNPFTKSEDKNLLVKTTPALPYQATAFFIDEEGRLATNRHVAVPWEDTNNDTGIAESLRQAYKEWLLDQLDVQDIQFLFTAGIVDAINKLQKTELGRAVLNNSDNINQARAILNTIMNSKVEIGGKIDFITVGYPGNNYTHEDDFERCYVVAESGDKNVDIAILQMNNKKTPTDILNSKTKGGKNIVILDPTKAVEETLVPMKDQYCLIGYPQGLAWGLDDASHSLEPSIRQTQCVKQPSRYNFELNADTYGGSSGSPVFDNKGNLVGILFGGRPGTSVTAAVHAKFLKELYEKEVGLPTKK